MGLGAVLMIIAIGSILAIVAWWALPTGNAMVSRAEALVDRSPRVLPLVDRDGLLIVEGVHYADGE